eukprot:CAMPEP_0185730382 /NCGR_PEP_ID=MMETSP1171-20130828/9717_1 /TAXON_ID=374046 /ORGANISM="Helicotheca tamensis, Strain CCMP826" /LENGTH=507 /DNA_ID=CAMNT_0028399413 /DNA_START=110 /DNA_END=1633 /DNA_ORIENTATION=-
MAPPGSNKSMVQVTQRISAFVTSAPRKLSTYVEKRRSSGLYAWPNLLEEAKEMTLASKSQYPITFLRREAKAGNLKRSDEILALFGEEESLAKDGEKRRSAHAADIIQIVEENREYITKKFGGDINWLYVFTQMDERATEGGDPGSIAFKKIDHEFEEKRAAYGINIDRNRQRATVVFRGTWADGTDDWNRNLQFATRPMETPSQLQDANEELPKEVNIHQGFYEYLFDNSERGEQFAEQRYEEVLNDVLPILKENPGYKLYITGHSLGGALGTLTAFKMAASNIEEIPKPITCISVGSPLVGDETFREAFHELEKTGWIRKLRITNDNDPVPLGPPVSLDGKVYRHVGINLRLADSGGSFDIDYPKADETFVEKFSKAARFSFLNIFSADPMRMHSCDEYISRMQSMAESLEGKDLNSLYQDTKLVGNLNETRNNIMGNGNAPYTAAGARSWQGTHRRVQLGNQPVGGSLQPAFGTSMYAKKPGYHGEKNPRSTVLTSHVESHNEE